MNRRTKLPSILHPSVGVVLKTAVVRELKEQKKDHYIQQRGENVRRESPHHAYSSQPRERNKNEFTAYGNNHY